MPAALVAGRSETIIIETQDCYGGRLTGEAETYSVTETEKQNPVTGPVLVEGAEPGDVLCIHIQDITVADRGVAVLRPKTGFLGSDIRKPFVYQAQVKDNLVIINQDVSVPLRPVVGVIGVAPRHGEIKTEYPGRHGGNMDTIDVTVGSRIFLPVQVKGGLLALGSVKACMGDGEVFGTGVEVAAEVTVRVDILPGGRFSWPRLETKQDYTTIASASSVDQASKLAVMEMVRWLEQEKGLDFETAYLLTGISGDLRISQWSNPLMTARMIFPRAVMNKIQRKSATGTRPIHISEPEEVIEETEEPEYPTPVAPSEPAVEDQETEAAEGETGEETPKERSGSTQRRRKWRRRRRPSGGRKRSPEGDKQDDASAKGKEASDTTSDKTEGDTRQQRTAKKDTSGDNKQVEGKQGESPDTGSAAESDDTQKPRSSQSRRRRSNRNQRRPRTYRRKPKPSGDGDKPDTGGDKSEPTED